jgi:putative endonuclease
MKWVYTYLLESAIDKSWYIGYTEDLERRIVEHNTGKSITTKKKMPWSVIYFEACSSKDDAIAREKYLKSGMGRRYLKNRLKTQFLTGPHP